MGDRNGLGWRSGAVVSMTVFAVFAVVAAACGSAAGYEVADGSYQSLVPSVEQFILDVDGSLPGGAVHLREQGVDEIEVEIDADQVTFRLDGIEAAAHNIVDRIDITDREGSGPFKAKKQVLVLSGTLTLGDLVIEQPVIWPGSFEGSPVITLKPSTPDERGPVISCHADESCLLLSSGIDPAGSYADANNPELAENPIESILINEQSVDVTLDSGTQVTIPAATETFTTACALSESPVWDLPGELGLAIEDPVLVHTLCPSTPGAAIRLIIMDRSAVPLLAPLTEAREGEWCAPGLGCLIFVPT